MSIDDCLTAAGVTDERLRALVKQYADNPSGMKKSLDRLSEEFTIRKKQAILQQKKWNALMDYFGIVDGKPTKSAREMNKLANDLNDLSGIRGGKQVSLTGRIDGVLAEAHKELDEMMEEFRPRLFGGQYSEEMQRNMLRAIFKETVEDATAREFALIGEYHFIRILLKLEKLPRIFGSKIFYNELIKTELFHLKVKSLEK